MKDPLPLVQEMIDGQRAKMVKLAKRLVPGVSEDDLWQPNDFPVLENHPEFRYEEGVLAGIQTVQAALRALNPTCALSAVI